MREKLQASEFEKCFYKLAQRSQDVFWMRSVDFQTQLYIAK